VPSDRSRGKKHKIKHSRFPLTVRKQFLTVRVSKLWYKLPREVADPPFLEIFKSCLDMFLGNWPRVAFLDQRSGPGGLQRSLPTLSIVRFCDSVKCCQLNLYKPVCTPKQLFESQTTDYRDI